MIDSLITNGKGRLGSLRDHVRIPFVDGVNTVLAYLQTMYYHVHGETFVYPKYAEEEGKEV